MYNRYIPQPDGSYKRRQETSKPTQERNQAPCPPRDPVSPPPPPPKQDEPCQSPKPVPPPRPCNSQPAGGFLRQLLPKDFDTGDLIVVLLLLLMAGDCEEDRNNALLTIALYFMM